MNGKGANGSRASRAVRGAALAAVLSLFAAGCAIEPPSAPSTNFVVSIPVSNDSTLVSDVIAERSDFLQVDPRTGGMAMRFTVPEESADERVLGRAEVAERLRVTPQSNTFTTPIGTIDLPGQSVPPIEVTMSQLLGQDVEPGTTVPIVPAVSFEVPAEFDLQNVESLVIQEGGLDLSITNDMPVALSEVRMELSNADDDSEIGAIDLGAIAANGGSASGAFVLDEKRLSGQLRIEVSGRTEQGVNVTVEEDDKLTVLVTLSDLLVSEATAVVPQQEFSDSQVLQFPDDRIQVTRAAIRQGGLVLRVRNDVEVIMEVELQLDDLRRPDGAVNTFLVDQLVPGELREVRFDLDGNEFEPQNPLELRLSYAVRTFPSERPVKILSSGEIFVEAITEDLLFDRVEGRLNKVSVPIPEERREIDIPDGLDNVSIGDASLDVRVTSAVGFLADVDLRIRGTNKFGRSNEIVLRERFERGDPGNPVTTTVSLDPDDLVPFLNLLPNQVAVEADVVIGDGQEVEVVDASHWVSIDQITFQTSPRLTVGDTTRIDPEVQDITFRDSDLRRRINTNFRSARIITDLENSIPLGVGVRLFVGRTPEGVYDIGSPDHVTTVPRQGRPPFQAVAAPVDGEGYSTGTEVVRREILLDKEDVLKFILEDSDPGLMYSGVRVTLPATGGEVEILGTDFINIISGLEIQLLLDSNLLD